MRQANKTNLSLERSSPKANGAAHRQRGLPQEAPLIACMSLPDARTRLVAGGV